MAKRNSIGFQLARSGMGILSRVVPPLGSRVVWSMFRKSPKPAAPNDEDQYFLESHGSPKELLVEGHHLRVYPLRPPGVTRMRVLMLHGWGSRATALLGIGKLLVREGAEVVLYDGPGSGLTKSRSTTLPQMIAALGVLQKEFGPFDVAVGHSIGGLVAAHGIAEGLLPSCRVLISIGSPNAFESMTIRLLQHRWQPRSTTRFFERKVLEIAGRTLDSFGIAKVLAPLPPKQIAYLCLHDHSDQEVPVSDAYEIGRALSWAKLEISNGLGHNRILREAPIQARVVEFIDRALYHDGK